MEKQRRDRSVECAARPRSACLIEGFSKRLRDAAEPYACPHHNRVIVFQRGNSSHLRCPFEFEMASPRSLVGRGFRHMPDIDNGTQKTCTFGKRQMRP